MIQTNDSPYGLFGWLGSRVVTFEPTAGSAQVPLTIVREQGNLGTVRLHYRLEVYFMIDFKTTLTNCLVFSAFSKTYLKFPLRNIKSAL